MGGERGRLARLSPDRRARARLGASLLAPSPLRRTFPDRPLRRLPRWGALAVLALLALALAWSATADPVPARAWPASEQRRAVEGPAVEGQGGDFALYARIAERVAAGESYYPAALAEHRAHNYPVRPFVTVRLPTLAWVNARLGRGPAGLLVVALLLANLAAWYRALADRLALPERLAILPLAFLAGFAAFEPRAALSHELVAGLLLSLALALYRPGLTWPALVALAAALAVRELALPFALLWLAFALGERRWREAGALAIVIGLFAAGLALHAFMVEQFLLPGDQGSPGWGDRQGPRLFIEALIRFTPLLALPPWLAGPLALLPLVGWLGLGGRLGLLAALWFTGFALVLALFARAENFYWVLMVLPAYALGLALVPRALADLARASRPRSG